MTAPLIRIADAIEQIRDHLLFPPDKQPSSDADPLPAADEAAGQPAAPTSSLPGAAGDRPWHDDPQEIARLWLWLDGQGLAPWGDVYGFLLNARCWPEERERMVREQGRVTTE